jgi:hypothetical protein
MVEADLLVPDYRSLDRVFVEVTTQPALETSP